jgi:outer membrane protein assembly factor BamB
MDKPSRHPVAISAGLVVAGLVALGVAAWGLAPDFSQDGPHQDWLLAAPIVIAVGALAVFATRHRRRSWLVWGFAVVGLGVVALGVVGFIAQYQSGFPGNRWLLMGIGGIAVAVGGVVIALVPPGRWRVPSVRSGLFGLSALVLVPVVAVPLLSVLPEWRLTATTAGAGQPAAVPESVSKVAWSAEVDGEINKVVSAGMGAVVMLRDGVVALDGTTGQIRWSRRWAGSFLEGADATPDGRTVILQVSPRGKGPLVRWEVLDAFTGEVRFTKELPEDTRPGNRPHMVVTSASYVDGNEDWSEFHAYSLIDGHRLWDFRFPAGCSYFGGLNAGPLGTNDKVLLPMTCADTEVRYVALDAAGGQERWRYSVAVEKPELRQFMNYESADMRYVTLWLDQVNPPHATLDTDTGKVVSHDNITLLANGYAAGDGRLVDLRNGQVVTVAADVARCARWAEGAVLARGAVCRKDDRTFLDDFMAGTADVGVARFGDQAVTSLSVSFGGPFDPAVAINDYQPFEQVAVPGAVVVHAGARPVGGVRSRVVGLS